MLDYEQIIDKLDWKKNNGLIPVIVQGLDGDLLTLGYTDKEALSKTLETGYVHYYSRSKERIRMKGETSGNYQKLKEVYVDCDNDTLLLKVDQTGSACHLGTKSCFRKIEHIDKLPESNIDYSLDFLNQLKEIIKDRKKNPKEGSYTTYLFNEGKEKIYKKFGEEAVEVLVAPNRERTIYETADMIYHLLVLLTYEGIDIGEVVQELKKRHSPEGGKQS